MSNFMKIRAVGAELFHPDGQTHMKTLMVALHNSANSRKYRWLSVSIRLKQIYVFVCLFPVLCFTRIRL